MKIVCGSCGAKYSIADEKVAGRVFKIRCKKCGAAIVVRGDQVGAQAETSAAASSGYAGDAVWHVVVEGEQKGPLAASELTSMLATGAVSWDSYVWREGFDDWKPASEVDELRSAPSADRPDVPTTAAAAEPAPRVADPSAGSNDQGAPETTAAAASPSAGASLFGGAGGVAEAAVTGRADDADLFAQTDSASPFGASSSGDDEVVAPRPIAAPRDRSLTGARNENSVLFSLSNLQALATGGQAPGGQAPGGQAPGQPGIPDVSPSPNTTTASGAASGEGSGLIDIRALAAATGVAGGGAAPAAARTEDRVDDLLSIGGGGGALGSSLGAPIVVPERREGGNKGLIIGLSVGGIVAVSAVAFAAVAIFSRGNEGTPVAATVPVTPGAAAAAPALAAAAGPAGTEAGDSERPSRAEPSAARERGEQAAREASAQGGRAQGGRAQGGRDSAREPTSARRERSSHHSARRARARSESRSRSASASSERRSSSPREDRTKKAASSRPSRGGGGSRDIDALLEGALGSKSGGSRTRQRASGGGGGSNLPAAPGRSAVQNAMRAVAGAVRACGNGEHGQAIVNVTFASSGNVSRAEATGSFSGPVKSCIARAVRRASVPRFSNPTFRVRYPFAL